MIREITFGQYYQADSTLHKLDPRVKLVGTIIYIVSTWQNNMKIVRIFFVVAAFLWIIYNLHVYICKKIQ